MTKELVAKEIAILGVCLGVLYDGKRPKGLKFEVMDGFFEFHELCCFRKLFQETGACLT